MPDERLKGYEPRPCGAGCKDANGKPIMLDPRPCETHGPGFSKVPGVFWEHSSDRDKDPHWRREQPIKPVVSLEGVAVGVEVKIP